MPPGKGLAPCLMVQGAASGVGESAISVTTLGAASPLARLERAGDMAGRLDGAVSGDGLVVGTNVHGALADTTLRERIVNSLAARHGSIAVARTADASRLSRWFRSGTAVSRIIGWL